MCSVPLRVVRSNNAESKKANEYKGKQGIGALGRIRTCDTRFRKPALYSASQTFENANEHRVFAFSRCGAFRCSVSYVFADLTDGLGADVTIEAVGVPPTFELAASLIRPGGRVANIGVHGEPATLHLEELWIKDVTITTGLVEHLLDPHAPLRP